MPYFFVGAQAAACALRTTLQAVIVDMRPNTHFRKHATGLHLTIDKGAFDHKASLTSQSLWEHIKSLQYPDVYTAAELRRMLPLAHELHNRKSELVRAGSIPKFLQCLNAVARLELEKSVFPEPFIVVLDPFDQQAVLALSLLRYNPVIVGLSRCWSFVSPAEAKNFQYFLKCLPNPGRFLFLAHQAADQECIEAVSKLSESFGQIFASDLPFSPLVASLAKASRPSLAVRAALDMLFKNTYRLAIKRCWALCGEQDVPDVCSALETRVAKGDYVIQLAKEPQQVAGKPKSARALLLTCGSTWDEIAEFMWFIAGKWDFAKAL